MKKGNSRAAKMTKGDSGAAKMKKGDSVAAKMKRGDSGAAKMKKGDSVAAKMKRGNSGAAKMKKGDSVAAKMKRGDSGAAKMKKVDSGTAKMKKGDSLAAKMKKGDSGAAKTKKGDSGANKIKKSDSVAAIARLPDDVLLMIFTHLNIKEKIGSVSRVCKRWNQVVKTGAIWRHVDMWELRQVLSSSQRRNQDKYQKPLTRRQKKMDAPAKIRLELQPLIKKERQALKFLQTYINGSLRTLTLCVVNNDILQFLHDNCPKLEVLCIGSSFNHKDFLPASGIRGVDLSLVPSSVVDLKIQSGWAERGRVVPPNDLPGLAKQPFPNMQQLVLERHVAFSPALFRKLSKCTKLRLLSLISFERIRNFDVISKGLSNLEDLCLQSCIREDATTNKVLRQISDNMPNLQYIKLRSGPTPSDEERSLNDGIGRLRSCQKLKRVWIENIHTYNISGFRTLTLGLPNLQEVIFVDCDEVDDDFLELIQTQLKTLKLLRLDRCPKLTDFGTKFLLNHPSMEQLEIVGKLQTTRVFPTPKIICEIAESMDNMKRLKVLVTGHPPTEVLKPHFQQLKQMRPEIDIAVYLRPDVMVDLSECSKCNHGL